MKKTKFALIGNPVSHSLSPIMHNYWFNKYNINAEYQPLNINENEIEKTSIGNGPVAALDKALREALLKFAISASRSKKDAARFLGLDLREFNTQYKKYNIESYFKED